MLSPPVASMRFAHHQAATVVLSPHCDDAVLSLGASIAATAERGMRVRVVTVFANDPEHQGSPSPWDSRAGFKTAAAAAAARRTEDDAALARLGADGVRLPFSDSGYLCGDRDDDEIFEAICRAIHGAGELWVPGFPLLHPDHAWLTALIVRRKPPTASVRFYVEQPYAWSTWRAFATRLRIERSPVSVRHVLRKVHALRCYRSQVRILGGPKLICGLLANDVLGRGEGFGAAPISIAGNSSRAGYELR